MVVSDIDGVRLVEAVDLIILDHAQLTQNECVLSESKVNQINLGPSWIPG